MSKFTDFIAKEIYKKVNTRNNALTYQNILDDLGYQKYTQVCQLPEPDLNELFDNFLTHLTDHIYDYSKTLEIIETRKDEDSGFKVELRKLPNSDIKLVTNSAELPRFIYIEDILEFLKLAVADYEKYMNSFDKD